RGGALAEALADVGARGFLAHRVQLVLAQDLLDLVEAAGGRARPHADPFGLAQDLVLLHLHGDARELGRRLLFGGGLVGLDGLRIAHDGAGAHRIPWFRPAAPRACGPGARRPRSMWWKRRL